MSGAMPQHYHIPHSRRMGLWGGTEIPDIYLHGSAMLKPFADQFGIELDQINFLFCEIIGIIGGTCIRLFLPANNKDPKIRQWRLLACGLIGVFTAFFCFGLRSLYLWAVTTLCYMLTRLSDPRYAHLIVFVVSVGYLSYLHIYRMMRDYGGYSLDITMVILNRPMMVIVQKITAFAFAVHDGGKDPKLLKLPDQPRHAIKVIPSYWEFCSYVFSFQSLLCGPFCFYDEYIDFIEGNSTPPSSYKKTEDAVKPSASGTQVVPSDGAPGSATSSSSDLLPPPQFHPSTLWPVLKKVAAAVFLCYVHITLVPGVPLDLLTDETNIQKLTVMQLMFYLLIATTFVRLKYYVAWLLSDAVANASGLGFNGYDELGKPRWDLVSNVDIIELEFSQSLRSALIAWNTCTARWLRYVAYDRSKFVPTVATYTLSAFWHGFYPGYYVTFLGGALFTEAARWGRRVIRGYFQGYRATRVIYDFITFLATRLALAYMTFPFVLLELRHAWSIYKALYFWYHIVAVVAVFGLPQLSKRLRLERPKSDKPVGIEKKSDGEVLPSEAALDQDINLRRRNISPTGTSGLEAAGEGAKNAQFAAKPATG